MTCRRCGHEFRVDLAGVVSNEETQAEASEPKMEAPIGAPMPPEVKSAESGLDWSQAETAIVDLADDPSASQPVEIGLGDGPTQITDRIQSRAIPPPDAFEEADSSGDATTAIAEFDAMEETSLDLSESADLAEPRSGGGDDPEDPFGDGLSDLSQVIPASGAGADGVSPADGVVSDELLAARDQARGGTVADDELASVLDDERSALANRDYDDDLTGAQPAERSAEIGSGLYDNSDLSPAHRAFETGKVSLRDLGGTFKRQPTFAKLGFGLALAALVALTALITRLLGPSSPEPRFVTQTVELRSGPAEGDAYRSVATLAAGTPVTVYGASAEYALVRDALGRAGYIEGQALAVEPPQPKPDQAFAGCRQAPVDPDLTACQVRAGAQLERCKEGCDSESCQRGCDNRFSECMAGCDTRLVVLDPLPIDDEPLEPETTAAAADPDIDSDAGDDADPVEDPVESEAESSAADGDEASAAASQAADAEQPNKAAVSPKVGAQAKVAAQPNKRKRRASKKKRKRRKRR